MTGAPALRSTAMLGASQCGHRVTIEAPHVMHVKYALYASCCNRITPEVHFGHSFFESNIGIAPFPNVEADKRDAANLMASIKRVSTHSNAFGKRSVG